MKKTLELIDLVILTDSYPEEYATIAHVLGMVDEWLEYMYEPTQEELFDVLWYRVACRDIYALPVMSPEIRVATAILKARITSRVGETLGTLKKHMRGDGFNLSERLSPMFIDLDEYLFGHLTDGFFNNLVDLGTTKLMRRLKNNQLKGDGDR